MVVGMEQAQSTRHTNLRGIARHELLNLRRTNPFRMGAMAGVEPWGLPSSQQIRPGVMWE